MTEHSSPGGVFALDPYGDELTARASGYKMLVNISYASGAPYQWAYELYRNACQVFDRTEKLRGDERIEFDFVEFPWVNYATDSKVSPIKRRIFNTGAPMDPHTELVPYYTSLGEGGGEKRFSVEDVSGGYGKGSRAGTLPHSDLMAITTQPGGKSHAIAILDTPESYRRGKFYKYNDDGTVQEVVQLAELDSGVYFEAEGWTMEMTTEALVHPDVIKKGGVTFILMGRKFRENYINGDVRKGEKDRGLVDALTKRINTNHPVHVSYLIPDDASARVDGRVRGVKLGAYRIDRRKINSYADWTARAIHKGSVTLDDHGTYVEWFLLADGFNVKGKFDSKKAAQDSVPGKFVAVRQREDGTWGIMTSVDSWLPWDGKGFLIAQYEHEMIPMYPGKKERLDSHRPWGITNESVSDRVGMIVHAPVQTTIDEWGVTQNESRSALTGPNGSPLPTNEWAEAFCEDFPAEIAAALKAMAPRKAGSISEEDVARLKASILARNAERIPRHIDVVVDEDPDGDAEGTGVDVDTTPEHTTDHKIHDPAVTPHEVARKRVLGGRKSSPKPVPTLPIPVPLTAEQWDEQGFDPKFLCVVVNGGDGISIYLNEAHEIYANQQAYYSPISGDFYKTRPALRRKVGLADAMNAVLVAYQTEAVVKVLWIHENVVPFSKSDFDARTTPQVMTDALSGYFNVDQSIATRIGGSAR